MAPLVRARLDIAYDGTNFAGWAAQQGQRTVQGVLTEALSTILRTPIALTVAGRTDSGVHATGQVAHCDIPNNLWHDFAGSFIKRLAGLLPPDVRVRQITQVPPEFDARFSALRRHYHYRIGNAPYGVDPLRRHDTVWWPRPLNLDDMQEASRLLLGEHDFAAYCRKRDNGTTIRALQQFVWSRGANDVLLARVSADAFCHSMVRSLVGAMLAVGEGRRTPQWPASLLTTTERASEITVAPAHGLTLVAVDYPPDEQLSTRANVTRQFRR